MKEERSFITDLIEEECRTNPEFKREYEAEKIAHELIRARLHHKIRQDQVADKMHTRQPSIVRLESEPANTSFGRIIEYASVLGYDLKLVKNKTGPKVNADQVSERRPRSSNLKEKRTAN